MSVTGECFSPRVETSFTISHFAAFGLRHCQMRLMGILDYCFAYSPSPTACQDNCRTGSDLRSRCGAATGGGVIESWAHFADHDLSRWISAPIDSQIPQSPPHTCSVISPPTSTLIRKFVPGTGSLSFMTFTFINDDAKNPRSL